MSIARLLVISKDTVQEFTKSNDHKLDKTTVQINEKNTKIAEKIGKLDESVNKVDKDFSKSNTLSVAITIILVLT